MAEKKKAYRRFEELTRQATAPMAAEAERDRGSMNLRRRSGWTGMGPPPAEAFPIRLSPQVRRALEQHAAADNTTPSEIVEEALRRYLEIPR
jgi:Ribbon-helix-helix protein, copG family